MEGLFVRFDWVTSCSPAVQSALQKCNPQETQGQSSMQDDPASLIARARAINDQVFVFRKQGRILSHFSRSKPSGAWDNYWVAQQIQRLTNVNNKHIAI
jgi:hypothetical protein